MKGQHLKLRLAGANNKPWEAVWWNCVQEGRQTPDVTGSIELAYTLETNIWNNELRIQLNVQDPQCKN